MSEYPKTCELCGYVMDSQNDLDWHGLGNCAEICAWCIGAGERDGKACSICSGSGIEREVED